MLSEYDATYSRNYKIFALDDHVNRFFNSAKLLEFKPEFTKEEVKTLLCDLVNKMDTGENFVYFQITRGTTPISNHVFPLDSVKPNLWVNIYPKNIADTYKKS